MAASIRHVRLTLPIYRCLTPKNFSLKPLRCMSSDENNQNEKPKKSKLDLAKPGNAVATKRRELKNMMEDDVQKDESLDPDLVDAAKKVAGTMTENSDVVESDLLQKLKEHVTLSDAQRQGQFDKSVMGSVFQGMKVEKKASRRRGQPRISDERSSQSISRGIMAEEKSSKKYDPSRKGSRRENKLDLSHLKLYDGKPMNVFPSDTSENFAKMESNFFDVLEKEELDTVTTFPPENAWQEAIRWTKEGKLRPFPINNELGMDEEADVPFHKHVFLEHLLEPFPKKGPIRNFMELVIVGLSKNPYVTLQQKYDHVAWFKDYFEDKYHIVEALMDVKDTNEATKN